MATGYRAPPLSQLELHDFSGGLNLRDSPTQLAANETPDCMNVTLDERGGVVKRLGLARLAALLAGAAKTGFYSEALSLNVIQIGDTLYQSDDDFATVEEIDSFSTTARVAFTDFQQFLVVVHPVDGVFTYDGADLTSVAAEIVGTCIATWQNVVVVAGVPNAPSLVIRCATGDVTGWTVGTDGCATNQLREKDDAPITALGVGQGQDTAGRPGLLAFKDDSAYRINDVETLAYTTIDGRIGCVGPLALSTVNGRTAILSKEGIYATDASAGTELVEVSNRIAPLFSTDQLNYSIIADSCAGIKDGHVLFSIPFGPSATANTLTLEYHPDAGWIVPHSFGAADFIEQHGPTANQVFTLTPGGTRVFDTFVGGTDDGEPIVCRYRTREILAGGGNECQHRRARVWGRGHWQLYTLLDMSIGQGELNDLDFNADTFVWNEFVWDDGSVWGPSTRESTRDIWSLGPGKSISFMMRQTSDDVGAAPRLLGTGVAPEVGDAAMYGLLLDYVQLGGS